MHIVFITMALWLLFCFTWFVEPFFNAIDNTYHYYDAIKMNGNQDSKNIRHENLNYKFIAKFIKIRTSLRLYLMTCVTIVLFYGYYIGIFKNQTYFITLSAIIPLVPMLTFGIGKALVTQKIKHPGGPDIRIVQGYEQGQFKPYLKRSLKRGCGFSCLAIVVSFVMFFLASVLTAYVYDV